MGLLSSIIKDDDYEYLGNHAIKAIKESGLFGLAQVRNHPPSLPFFDYYSYFLPNLCFTLAGVADDERFDGPLSSPSAMDRLLEREG